MFLRIKYMLEKCKVRLFLFFFFYFIYFLIQNFIQSKHHRKYKGLKQQNQPGKLIANTQQTMTEQRNYYTQPEMPKLKQKLTSLLKKLK